MFTVIILSAAAKEIFDKSKIYFAPYEEAGDIAFCEWNAYAKSDALSEVLPDLPSLIKGKATWRAVVVDHPRCTKVVAGRKGIHDTLDKRDRENPFDFLDAVDPLLSMRRSTHALVRLAHILGGYPRLGAKGFIPVLRYRDENNQIYEHTEEEAVEVFRAKLDDPQQLASFDSASEQEKFSAALQYISDNNIDVHRIYRKVEYSQAEKQKYEELAKIYDTDEVRPTEIYFIATRAPITPEENVELERSWGTYVERDSSRFVERNDYPSMVRFAVYEMLGEKNSGYQHDELRFWLSILSLAINEMPPSSFQAERLYEISVNTSADRLSEMLNEHMSKLLAAKKVLQKLIARPLVGTSMEVDDLLMRVKIDVDFESISSTDLEVPTSGYGWFSDIPRLESMRWANDYRNLNAAVTRFQRKPRRILARSTESARSSIICKTNSPIILDDIKRDEIQDSLDSQMRPLLVSATTSILDKGQLRKALDEHNKKITQTTVERLHWRPALCIFLFTILIWLATFIPYFFILSHKSTEALLSGFVVLLAVFGVLALGGCGALLWSRLKLRRQIQNLNRHMRQFVNNVNSGAKIFSEYLSNFVTFRHSTEMLRGSQRAHDIQQENRNHWARILDKVDERYQDEKEIVRAMGKAIEIEEHYQGVTEADVANEDRLHNLFRFEPTTGNIPFNNSGEQVKAPYRFISSFRLERLRLFEPQFVQKEDCSSSEGGES